jgi:bifunctional non-homologous end joining protein LigD
VAYLVFDLLQLDGEPIIDRPYVERRGLLEELGLSGPAWAVPPAFDGDGQAALDVARDRRLEGVVAKRLASTYVPGARSRDWRKIKFVERESFVVGGWLPGEGNRSGELGALLVGQHDDEGALRFAGGVGTGFTGATLRMLGERLAALARADSPFVGTQPAKRTARFVEPELVVDVEYREVTRDGILRQPSYKGLRPDLAPADVVGQRRVGDGDPPGAR